MPKNELMLRFPFSRSPLKPQQKPAFAADGLLIPGDTFTRDSFYAEI